MGSLDIKLSGAQDIRHSPDLSENLSGIQNSSPSPSPFREMTICPLRRACMAHGEIKGHHTAWCLPWNAALALDETQYCGDHTVQLTVSTRTAFVDEASDIACSLLQVTGRA